ncbi:23S rRNA (pseudouridine(1915)-N(3))-methyltransferase RlmH [Lewinella sp. JB7]|uniref:23S rRNA (pseudouridine(1915)-N(3))-methyltransferase RlmH n=1 Tax=Lewinella sp. JB7 TaxID=2962887 RepID=UPI0020CA0290|nr:23S rRNA (pseudouridine(1915)-N(3))-methyltransferase RlmH [Lewinella sp. JB7]MCP9235198.1 23S rRNA (pseudouridine(1915)-N(3))-methyltransferase RlmH [Lewinella sp. JB7]
MKVVVMYIGKTSEAYLRTGEAVYQKRLTYYLPITFEIVPDVRKAGKLAARQLLEKEAEAVLARLAPDDRLILLDEGGDQLTSEGFAAYMERELQRPARRLVFLVGGAYGFAPLLYERADAKLSLSKMTFSHQMIRLFFTEQLYRAMTILRNEKYHNP